MPGNKAQRYYLLDVVKIFAVWIIMLHHFQQVFDVKFPYVNFYGGTFNCGYLVELFFMISGFLAIYSSECHPRHLCRDFFASSFTAFPYGCHNLCSILVYLFGLSVCV